MKKNMSALCALIAFVIALPVSGAEFPPVHVWQGDKFEVVDEESVANGGLEEIVSISTEKSEVLFKNATSSAVTNLDTNQPVCIPVWVNPPSGDENLSGLNVDAHCLQNVGEGSLTATLARIVREENKVSVSHRRYISVGGPLEPISLFKGRAAVPLVRMSAEDLEDGEYTLTLQVEGPTGYAVERYAFLSMFVGEMSLAQKQATFPYGQIRIELDSSGEVKFFERESGHILREWNIQVSTRTDKVPNPVSVTRDKQGLVGLVRETARDGVVVYKTTGHNFCLRKQNEAVNPVVIVTGFSQALDRFPMDLTLTVPGFCGVIGTGSLPPAN